MKINVPASPRMPDTPATRSLIVLNAGVWLLGWFGDVLGVEGISTESLLYLLGLFPTRVLGEGMLWTPFTYMFLHGNGTHLFVNMLGLFLLGPDLERTFRPRLFLGLYLLSGWMGGVAYVLISSLLFGQFHPCVGASGAIMGLLGAIVALYPRRVYVLLPLMIPLRASTLAVLLVSSHLLFMLTPYGGRVAYDVHMYGALTGYGFAFAAATVHRRRWRRKLPEVDWDRDAVELERLILRCAGHQEPLDSEEERRLETLRHALRYEDVLTVEEAESSNG